jgi:hypothetical protein
MNYHFHVGSLILTLLELLKLRLLSGRYAFCLPEGCRQISPPLPKKLVIPLTLWRDVYHHVLDYRLALLWIILEAKVILFLCAKS